MKRVLAKMKKNKVMGKLSIPPTQKKATPKLTTKFNYSTTTTQQEIIIAKNNNVEIFAESKMVTMTALTSAPKQPPHDSDGGVGSIHASE